LQAKLLRVLNNGEFHPLGSITSYHSDARIISATNRDLEEWVRLGKFREDLYYRINVIAVHVPALKERLEDLPVLIEYFISKFSAKRGKVIQGMSPEALQALRRYDFPGNIRELENAIEHAFVLCGGDTIELCHLPPKIIQSTAGKADDARRNKLTDKSEEAIIREALVRNLGNRDRTAQELGLHRTTLWRKITKYGIDTGK